MKSYGGGGLSIGRGNWKGCSCKTINREVRIVFIKESDSSADLTSFVKFSVVSKISLIIF